MICARCWMRGPICFPLESSCMRWPQVCSHFAAILPAWFLMRFLTACRQHPSAECATLATLSALDLGYRPALRYLDARFPDLHSEIGRAFVAGTDECVRVFMTTMATAALRYGVYVVASNTQAPFALTHAAWAVAASAIFSSCSAKHPLRITAGGNMVAPTGGRTLSG